MALIEHDLPVIHACGHMDSHACPVGDDAYHRQVLQECVNTPCFTCDNLNQALGALRRGDLDAAYSPFSLFVESAIFDRHAQPLIEALEAAQRAIAEAKRQEGWWRNALCD